MSGALVHATAIALWDGGLWRGLLLRGPSGAGKSTVALRAMDAGWRLVADDHTLVWRSGGALFGRSPQPIADLIEARGLGVLRVQSLPWASIELVVDLRAQEAVERMPEPSTVELCEVETPLLALYAHDSAVVEKLSLALRTVFPCAATSLGLVP